MIDTLRWELLAFLLLGAAVFILAMKQRFWKQNALALERDLNDLRRRHAAGALTLSLQHISPADRDYLRAQAALPRREHPWQAKAAAGPDDLWLFVPERPEGLQEMAEREQPGAVTPYYQSLALMKTMRFARRKGYHYLHFSAAMPPMLAEDLEYFEDRPGEGASVTGGGEG